MGNEIRPGLKIAAAFLLGTAALVVWLVLAGGGNPEARARGAERGDGSLSAHAGRGSGWSGPSSRRMRWDREDGWSGGAAELGAGLDPAPHEDDPQVLAMNRSHGGGGDAGMAPDFYPTTRRGRLTRVTGDLPVASGAQCEVRVLPVRTHTFNCLIKVMCDGVVIYPEPGLTAGYVSCDLDDGFPIRAVDDGVTDEDGDPTVDFDLHARRVVVSDARTDGRSFAAELDIDPMVRPRRL